MAWFGTAVMPAWPSVLHRIPGNGVGDQTSRDRQQALIDVSGIPDVKVVAPQVVTGFNPATVQASDRMAAEPSTASRPINELSAKGVIDFFENGISSMKRHRCVQLSRQGLMH